MKSTGVVRRVDELGRIVIPIELRRTLDIAEKDALEIYVDGEQIIYRFSYLRQLNALKLEQKKAIHEENFERAAQLRDEIHKLEEAHKEAKESGKDSKESA